MYRRLILLAVLLLPVPAGAQVIEMFEGCEHGDGSIWDSDNEAGDCTTSTARTGSYGMQPNDANEGFDCRDYAGAGYTCTGTGCENRLFGFAVQATNGTTNTSTQNMAMATVVGDTAPIAIRWVGTTNSDALELIDYGGTTKCTLDAFFPDTTTWQYVELYFENTDTGAFEVFVDGSSQCSGTGDFLGTVAMAGSTNAPNFEVRGTPGAIVTYDDMYCMTGASTTSRLLPAANRMPEVFIYYSTVASATDNGTALDIGQWDDSAPAPSGTYVADQPEYDVSSASGTTDFNGPSGDSNIDGDSNMKAVWFHWRAGRQGGGSTTHTLIYGNDVDGDQSFAPTLPNGYDRYSRVYEAANVLPTSTQNCRMGGSVSGAQDMRLDLMHCNILHVPDAPEPQTSPSIMWIDTGARP